MLTLTLVGFFLNFLVFHEVLIYYCINELMEYSARNIKKYIVNLVETNSIFGIYIHELP